VAGTYADIKFAHGGFGAGQNFSALFRCVVAALNDSELPVRWSAGCIGKQKMPCRLSTSPQLLVVDCNSVNAVHAKFIA
jgi:hypothetical protein